VQEQSTDITPKGENAITLEDMEEKGSTVRRMWHSAKYSDTTILHSRVYDCLKKGSRDRFKKRINFSLVNNGCIFLMMCGYDG